MKIPLPRRLVLLDRFLRLRPFDTSTESGRSQERQRRAFLSTMAAFAAKGIAIVTQLVTVPMTLNYLGAERFGLWMAISSVVSMLAFADLGVGNGLLRAPPQAPGRGDAAGMRAAISSATVFLSGVSFVVLLLLGIAHSEIPWATFFNVHTPLATFEAEPAATAFLVCFALNIPATMVQRIQLGLQMGFVANLWLAGGSALSLIGVLICVHFHVGLQWLVVSFAGAPVVANTANALLFFSVSRPDLRPQPRLVTRSASQGVIRTGLMFLILQLVAALIYTSDSVVIARIMGASAVAVYAVPDKMFGVIPLIMSMVLLPLWPAYGEAIARNDIAWVHRILKKTIILSLLVSVSFSLAFCLFGERLLSLWAGHAIFAPAALLLGMGLWKVIEAVGNSAAVYLNGNNLIREQVVIACPMAITALFAKFYLVTHFGVAGAIWSTVLAYLTVAAVPIYLLVRKSLARHVLSTSASNPGN